MYKPASITSPDISLRLPAGTQIAMATPRYFPLSGGVENHVYQVARRLVQRDVQVTVLTTDRSGKLPPTEVVEGICIKRVPAFPRSQDFYFAPAIYNLVLNGAWDLLHVQSYHTFVPFLAMPAAIRAGIPYVLTFHGGGHTSALRHAIRPLQRAVLRPLLVHSERLVALTRFEIDQYGNELNLQREKFVIIPNGAELLKADQVTAHPQPGETLILSIGRLEKYKGHQRAISAFPHLLAQQPSARLRIVGVGPYEDALRSLAQQLNISDRVEIGGIPPENRAEMADLIARSSLVVLLSDFETHPISALEALSLKRPVLVANNSGMKELAENGWARAIPTNCLPEETARAMLEQIRHPLIPENLYLPTWDDCANQLEALYASILCSRSPARFQKAS